MAWYRRLQRLPVRTKLLLTLVGVGVLVLGSVVVGSLAYWRQETVSAAEVQALLAARSVRANVESALTYERPEQAHRGLRRLTSEPHVLAARVYRPDGSVLLSSRPAEQGRHDPETWIPSAADLPPGGVVRVAEDGRVLHAFVPLTSARGEVLAVDFSLSTLQEAARRGLWLGVGLLIASLASLGVVVYLMVQREVVRPLRAMEGMIEAAGGDAGRPRGPEIDRLAASVADLIEKEEAAERTVEVQRRRLAESEGLAQVGEFAAEMAHELKRPLTTVRTAVDLLEQEYRLDEEGERLLEEVDGQLSRLSETMSDLFALARPVEIESERIDPAPLLDEALAEISSHPASRKVEIRREFDPDLPDVAGDSRRLRQAVVNLLLNGTESMPEGGTLTLRATEGEAGELVVEVRDTGGGIPTSEIERVTRPFYSTKPRGTGLGLPLVSRIVSAHGGRLEIESEVGRGTTARIRLPAGAGETALTGEA